MKRIFRLAVRPPSIEQDVDTEIEFHLATEVERLMGEGMTPAEARRAAERQFGDRERVRAGLVAIDAETRRADRRRDWWGDLRRDLGNALRMLRRSPGFAVVAILTLGLGIGATTAIFSVVDGVLLRPAPFPDIDRLVVIWETDRHSGSFREPTSIPDYADFGSRSRELGLLAAFMPAEVNYSSATDDPARLPSLVITHQYLSMVGITPIAGRTFLEEEDRPGAPRVAMISEAMWVERFARSEGIVGRSIRLNDVEHVVVGVLPSTADFGTLQLLGAADYGGGFADRGGQRRVDIWLPLRASPATADRGNHPIFVMGRLSPMSTIATAQHELDRVAADLEQAFPDANDGRGVQVEALPDVVFGAVRPALGMLAGAVALVGLIACVNVANLLLARGTARMREVTVRAALGASASRLTRQFLVEGGVLSGLGALVGVAIAAGALRLMMALAPASIPRVQAVSIDLRVLTVTLLLTAVVGGVFGMVPALQARWRGLDLSRSPGSSRGASRGREDRQFRSVLVVAELALAVMLMVGAGLLIRSFWELYQVDPGFRAAGVLKAEFQLPTSRFPQRMQDWPNWQEARQFTDELRRRALALPGAVAVGIAGSHPLESGFTSSIVVIGREAEAADWPEPSIRAVDPWYFETMQVPVLAGRSFSASDDASGLPVVVINEAARDRFFGDRDPLGQAIRLWGAQRTVVGVVVNERFKGLAQPGAPAVYLPSTQAPLGGGSLLVRATGDPLLLAAGVRAIVHDLDPALPIFGVEPLVDTMAGTTGERRFAMLLLATFAGLALLLAAVGVHGVLSYSVAQRTREIGIRMALGADRRSIRRLVLAQGARLVMIGLAIGILGAIAVTRLLTSLLYAVRPSDPATIAAVVVGLGSIALLASWLPARRAAGVDPVETLGEE